MPALAESEAWALDFLTELRSVVSGKMNAQSKQIGVVSSHGCLLIAKVGGCGHCYSSSPTAIIPLLFGNREIWGIRCPIISYIS